MRRGVSAGGGAAARHVNAWAQVTYRASLGEEGRRDHREAERARRAAKKAGVGEVTSGKLTSGAERPAEEEAGHVVDPGCSSRRRWRRGTRGCGWR